MGEKKLRGLSVSLKKGNWLFMSVLKRAMTFDGMLADGIASEKDGFVRVMRSSRSWKQLKDENSFSPLNGGRSTWSWEGENWSRPLLVVWENKADGAASCSSQETGVGIGAGADWLLS